MRTSSQNCCWTERSESDRYPLNAQCIEDLHIHIGGRCIEHRWPSERLKSRVGQSRAGIGVPLSTRPSGPGRHGEHRNRLDAVECVVRENRAVVARIRRHQLMPLREHIDGTGGIGHDLVHEPMLERADQSLVPVVDHQQGVAGGIFRLDHHLLHELGLPHRERVMGNNICYWWQSRGQAELKVCG